MCVKVWDNIRQLHHKYGIKITKYKKEKNV